MSRATLLKRVVDLGLGISIVFLGLSIWLGILNGTLTHGALHKSLFLFFFLSLLPVLALFSVWYGFAGLAVAGVAFWISYRLRRRWQRILGAAVGQSLLTGYGFLCIVYLGISA